MILIFYILNKVSALIVYNFRFAIKLYNSNQSGIESFAIKNDGS